MRNLIVSGIPAFGTFFSFSASVSATLEDTTGGFSASDGPEGPHSAGPVLAPFSLDRGISPGLVMDPALASVTLGGGGPIPAENSFTPIGYTGFPGLPSYSYADHILTDTLINGLPVGLPTFGGDWEGIAETAVVGDVKGAGLSGNLQSWNFFLSIAAPTISVIDFDIDATTIADLTSEGLLGRTATGDVSLAFDFIGDPSGPSFAGPDGQGATYTLKSTTAIGGSIVSKTDAVGIVASTGVGGAFKRDYKFMLTS